MASVDVVPMNGDVGSRHGVYDDISHALTIKREEIEREIQEFRKQKEEEYEQYEQSLRHRSEIAHADGVATAAANSKSAPDERSAHNAARPSVHRRSSSEQRRLGRPARSVREALNQAFSSTTEEGRDFEGVFTPGYLALIDPVEPKKASPSDGASRETENKSKLSSSASLHPPLIYPWSNSTTGEYHVSTSAPERHSAVKTHHRSDSANSTLSAQSLRSSLKDPKTPKSPKRVLFSIEDGVVSPSTSPSLNRKDQTSTAGETNAPESLLSFAKRTSREKKKKNRRKERGDGDRGRRGRDEEEESSIAGKEVSSLKSQLQPQEMNTTATIEDRDAFARLNSPPSKTFATNQASVTSSAIEDDMFTFDEELSSGSRPTSSSSAEDADPDDEVSASGSKVLDEMGTSPHAGSLPIEIKWPERRESGASG